MAPLSGVSVCVCVFSGAEGLYGDSLFISPFGIIYVRLYDFLTGINVLYLKKLSGALHSRLAEAHRVEA